ncbi:hypothetical protein K449DRAFT_156295 [Hypoxylon sp. EC38]|nr:hypothetical protein K449DRAFT_156295 [Hypoxylon sp. EC38]
MTRHLFSPSSLREPPQGAPVLLSWDVPVQDPRDFGTDNVHMHSVLALISISYVLGLFLLWPTC